MCVCTCVSVCVCVCECVCVRVCLCVYDIVLTHTAKQHNSNTTIIRNDRDLHCLMHHIIIKFSALLYYSL